MSICSAEPERADRAAAGLRRHGPRLRLERQDKAGGLDRDVRVEFTEIEVWRNVAVLEAQHHLDHARRAGRGLQMTKICLDRAEITRALRARLPVDFGKRLELDRVAHDRAGAVRLDKRDP